MKKTTIKVSWDNLWALNKLSLDLSKVSDKKVTQDDMLRLLLDSYSKSKGDVKWQQ